MSETEGFVAASSEEAKRLVVCTQGAEKCGKTDFEVWAPDPVGILNIDDGLEGVVGKALTAGRKISVANYRDDWLEVKESKEQKVEGAVLLWERFKKDLRDSLSPDSPFRTVAVDTATEFWELIRIARFGKVSQVKPIHYGPVTAEFIQCLRQVFITDKNFILSHKVKDQWLNDQRTGVKERDGFSKMGYIAQVNLEFGRIDIRGKAPTFTTRILDCRRRPEAINQVLENARFVDVALKVFPEVKREFWQ